MNDLIRANLIRAAWHKLHTLRGPDIIDSAEDRAYKSPYFRPEDWLTFNGHYAEILWRTATLESLDLL